MELDKQNFKKVLTEFNSKRFKISKILLEFSFLAVSWFSFSTTSSILLIASVNTL